MANSQAKGLIKGLENWAKKVTVGYRDVDVRDMSVSFRDGLAFCAIIHHYRPDLIDFESLSKENIFQNNSVAFGTAEKQLGVPALLDAEDMVKFARPDRLSIITYLSQLHNCFINQNKVKTLTPGKKIRQNSSAGPPPKMPALESKLLTVKRHEVCQVCGHRVFILERLIVDSKLYHTACFRCSKCKCLLNPGAYVESDTPGLYECAVCLPEESSSSMETQDSESYDSSGDKYNSLEEVPTRSPSPMVRNSASRKSPLTESVTHARSNFLQNSLSSKSNELKKDTPVALRNSTTPDEDPKKYAVKEMTLESGVSVKDKINVFESNRNSKPESFFKSPELITSTKFKLPSAIIASSNNVPADESKTNSTVSISSPSNAEKLNIQHNGSLRKIDKTFPAVDPGTASVSDSKTVLKSTLTFDKQSVEHEGKMNGSSSYNLLNDKQVCDSPTSVSLRNKVPTSTNLRHSLQFQSLSDETDTSKVSSIRQFQIGEYKSPLKSRDIFQTNIQPLKLSIPTISSSKKESSITSPESVKASTAGIPSVKPTYATTLPRQSSTGNLTVKENLSDTYKSLDGNLSDVLHSKWSRTTPRRCSFESQSENSTTSDIKPHKTLEREESKSLTEMNLEGSGDSFKSGEFKSRFNSDKPGSPFSSSLNYIPVPKVRHSLEIKKNLNSSELTSATKQTDIHSDRVFSGKNLRPEETPEKQKAEPRLPNDINLISKSVTESQDVKSEVGEVQADELYPTDLNPFGDDIVEQEYPDDLNPFGDDEEVIPKVPITVTTEDYDESKNPFASDDEDTGATQTPTKVVSPKSLPVSSPNTSFSPLNFSTTPVSSPTGSLRGTTKKRLAPKPPKLSDIFPTDSQDSEADVSLSSLKSSPSIDRKSLHSPSPKPRRNKPTAPPPPVPTNRQSSQNDLPASTKQMKEADNMKIKSSNAVKEAPKMASKKKKRPAPPVPIPKRKDNIKIPLKEILREMREIEEKQRECERQGREIELLIRDRDKDEEATVEEEEFIMQLFDLVNQKNALFRRQAELMYIKRSQRLEEHQAEIETQIRQLLMKPDSEKTEEDRTREEELILELKDIVDQRSSIIDSIEMDRRRELEEDASVQEQIEIKNGDLPIAAEIKEKSNGKKKEKKAKKEKKKKDKAKKDEADNDDSKKGSKKKGLFK